MYNIPNYTNDSYTYNARECQPYFAKLFARTH